MDAEQIQHTRDWWTRLCQNPDQMHRWLSKLRDTEYGGGDDHRAYMGWQREIGRPLDARLTAILSNIADDEYSHGAILDNLLEARGWEKLHVPPSAYWEDILEGVVSPQDYCAANYYGEAAACDRFTIMFDMPITPSDIREFIGCALPDETFHRVTLRREAGADALERFRLKHEAAMAKITGRK